MNYKEVLKKVGAALLALTFWEIAALLIHQRILLVTPVAVARRLCTIWRVEGFARAIWFSFYLIAGGFLLGLILGCLLAYLAAKHPVVETLLWPWMAMIKSVPVASFVVICLIWLSARNLSVFISFLIVIPIIYQNVLEGLRAENREMQEVATVFQLPWRKRFRYIELPKIRPFLLSACRVTTGMAWKAGIAAEIIGVPNGSIGKMLYTAKIYLDTDDLLAWTVIIVVISVVAEKVFLAGLSRLLNPCSRFMEDTDAGH